MQNHLKVLIVDDDQNILDGLRRTLHHLRPQWDTEYALGGKAALQLLQSGKYDVIVSDLRMPEMSGDELLEIVRRRYPEVIRIILSGYSQKESIYRLVGVAHQCLAKPCSVKAIVQAIEQTSKIRELLSDRKLKYIISQLKSLPSIPSVYHELVAELRSPNVSMKQVGKIIVKDVGMTSKILQLVNSAFFGMPKHVSDPTLAVNLLGINTIISLVLTVNIFSQFKNPDIPKYSLARLMEHSLKTAIYAKTIAELENATPLEVDISYTAGLLHDAGMYILIDNLYEEYAKIYLSTQRENLSIVETERNALGTTHAELGAYLLGIWGLPDSIVGAVAYHHEPGKSLDDQFTSLTAVYAASLIEECLHQGKIKQASDFLNTDYLDKLRLLDHIPSWIESCQAVQVLEING